MIDEKLNILYLINKDRTDVAFKLGGQEYLIENYIYDDIEPWIYIVKEFVANILR